MTMYPSVVLEPLRCVLVDLAEWRPELRTQLDDMFRVIETRVRTRGTNILFIDFPKLGKICDKGFSQGWIDLASIPHTLVCAKKGTILDPILSLVFDRDGSKGTSCDPTDLYFLRQVLYLYKKINRPCSDAANLAAVEDFFEVDSKLRAPTGTWNKDQLYFGEVHFADFDNHRYQQDVHDSVRLRSLSETLQTVCDLLCFNREVSTYGVIPSHGPGAVSDRKSGEDKYAFPYWPEKLGSIFSYEAFGQHREDLHLEFPTVYSTREPAAKLVSVPKTVEKPRLIASEPTAHQFLQQGLMHWIRDNMNPVLRTCIDFTDQSKSQDFALLASKSGDYATIDLSMASDRLSCWVVERAFRRNRSVLTHLHACRSRVVVDGTGCTSKAMELKKFAPMGSAVTFPVQSIIYACMCIAAILVEDTDWSLHHRLSAKRKFKLIARAAREVRVFGDDLIVPNRAVRSLYDLLEVNQLEVNESKSHWTGHFRESCGMDAYKGIDVTPCYITDYVLGNKAADLVAWVVVSNNAHMKGLFTLAAWLTDQIPQKMKNLIPISDHDLSCLTLASFCKTTLAHKYRFNKDLQRREVLGLQVKVAQRWCPRESFSSLFQFFLDRPKPETNWRSGFSKGDRILLRKRWVSAE